MKFNYRYRVENIGLIDSISNPLVREFGTKIYFVASLKYPANRITGEKNFGA